MECPRLGVQSELQLSAYATATATLGPSHLFDLHHSSWQCQIFNTLSEARGWTHNLMAPSQSDSFPLCHVGNSWLVFLFFFFFRASPMAYGSSQAGVELELQLPSYTTAPQPQQCRIWAVSVAYSTAHSNTGALTHWAGPGMEPESSWILVEFITC